MFSEFSRLKMYSRGLTATLALTMLWVSPGNAHHAMGGEMPGTLLQGILSGFAHPLIGLDHFAFLLVVGLLSFTLRSLASYIVPLAFVGATLAGTAIHLAGFGLPWAEVIIAASVVIGGVLSLLTRQIRAISVIMISAVFGIFHGYAYGESIVGAEDTALLAYLVGFSAIQYTVVTGFVLGLRFLERRSTGLHSATSKLTGSLATLTGLVFLTLNLA